MSGKVFFWKQAAREYAGLDDHRQRWVDAAVRWLERSGPGMGRCLLADPYVSLAGFQELGNQKLGVRLIYCPAQSGEIEVICIEQMVI